MDASNPKVDDYLRKSEKWGEESRALRKIIRDCGLTEEFKWRQPCYTFENANVVIIQNFKDYCAVMFFKGALLKDPAGILVKPGKHTQAGRQIRYTTIQDVAELEATLKVYVYEAIEVERAGLKVELKTTEEFKIPEEFQTRLVQDPALENAFNALTPGRQRAYIYYFSSAKQSTTRQSRVDKCIPKILNGQGLNDP